MDHGGGGTVVTKLILFGFGRPFLDRIQFPLSYSRGFTTQAAVPLIVFTTVGGSHEHCVRPL